MSGFRGTRNVNGRPKGAVGKTTAETKELLQTILGKEINKLGLLLGKLEPLERVNAIAKLLPFIVPKQIQQGVTITPPEMTDEQREARIEYLKKKLLE
jgi:hypothetical protein